MWLDNQYSSTLKIWFESPEQHDKGHSKSQEFDCSNWHVSPHDHVFCAYCCGTVDPETRKQAEEAVRACQQQIAMCEEERRTLDNRKAQYKTEEVEVDARLSDIKKRRDLITQVESKKVSMQNRLSTCFRNFFLVFRSTHINISYILFTF